MWKQLLSTRTSNFWELSTVNLSQVSWQANIRIIRSSETLFHRTSENNKSICKSPWELNSPAKGTPRNLQPEATPKINLNINGKGRSTAAVSEQENQRQRAINSKMTGRKRMERKTAREATSEARYTLNLMPFWNIAKGKTWQSLSITINPDHHASKNYALYIPGGLQM